MRTFFFNVGVWTTIIGAAGMGGDDMLRAAAVVAAGAVITLLSICEIRLSYDED